MATAIAFVFVDNPETVTGTIGEDSGHSRAAMRTTPGRRGPPQRNPSRRPTPTTSPHSLRDFAYLLERAEREGLFGYQPINYGPEATS